MICQYCGSALNTGGTCLNPACPGRLRPTGESSNGATSGQDSTLLGPAPVEVEDLLDHIISAANSVSIPSESNYLNELKSRLLAALSNKGENLSGDVNVPVEKLEQDLEQYITLGSTECRTIAEDVEFNRLHSKFLAALSNKGENLSGDVKVSVEELEANKKNLFLLTEACKLAYRKHHLGDESIGWDELGDVLHNVLYTVMDNGPYLDWLDSLQIGKAGE